MKESACPLAPRQSPLPSVADSFRVSLHVASWHQPLDQAALLWDLMTLSVSHSSSWCLFSVSAPGVVRMEMGPVLLTGCAPSLAQGQVGLPKILLNEWMSDPANVSNLCCVQGNTLLLHSGFWLLVPVILQCLPIKQINLSPLYTLTWLFVSSIGKILKYHC